MTVSAMKMKGKLFQTKGSRMLRMGMPTKSTLSASFSRGVHSLARSEGMVNIQMDHILRRVSGEGGARRVEGELGAAS